MGEVLVNTLYTSVCHTDLYTLLVDDPEVVFPTVLGHEGRCAVHNTAKVEDRALTSVFGLAVIQGFVQAKAN